MREEYLLKMLQNHLAACEHSPSSAHNAEVCPSHDTWVMLYGGALNLLFESENLAFIKTGGRTSQVGMGMSQMKTRPEPYSGM